jgi:hypothetical protein
VQETRNHAIAELAKLTVARKVTKDGAIIVTADASRKRGERDECKTE